MTIKQDAEKAMHLGKQLQAVIDIGEVLNEIGDLEVAKTEAKRDARKAHEDCNAALEDFDLVTKFLDTVRSDLKVAKAEVMKTHDDGIIARDHMIAEARAERDNMVRKATQSSEALIARANSEINGLQDRRDVLLKEITDSQERVTNLENQMRGLKERLG